jgi:hypothetical protein
MSEWAFETIRERTLIGHDAEGDDEEEPMLPALEPESGCLTDLPTSSSPRSSNPNELGSTLKMPETRLDEINYDINSTIVFEGGTCSG